MKLIIGLVGVVGLLVSCLYNLGGDVYRALVTRYVAFLRSFRKFRDGAAGLHHLYMGAPNREKVRENQILIPKQETAQ